MLRDVRYITYISYFNPNPYKVVFSPELNQAVFFFTKHNPVDFLPQLNQAPIYLYIYLLEPFLLDSEVNCQHTLFWKSDWMLHMTYCC